MRAGLRRHAGTDPGDRYARWLAHFGTGDAAPPKLHERGLGDLLHPGRPGRPTWLVNAVSAEVGADVAGWRWERVVSFYATLEQRESESPES